MILTTFEKIPVISTYVVTIALLRFVHISFLNKMKWYHQKRSSYIKFIKDLNNNVTEHMKTKEWENLNPNTSKIIVSPEYPYESREYFGLIFYRYYTLYIM